LSVVVKCYQLEKWEAKFTTTYTPRTVTATLLVLEFRKITYLFLKNVFTDTHKNFKAGYLVLYGERQIGSCVLSFLMLMLLRLCTPYKWNNNSASMVRTKVG